MMKNILLLLLFATWFTNAQIVTIPDANFKAALIAEGVDTNTDGDIQESEALILLNLDVSNYNISDLTGIEAFTNLVELNCGSNQLSSFDISLNLSLEILWCFNNLLTNLDVTQNVNLLNLNCFGNQISNLDVTQNANLEYLDCVSNNLSNIDVTQNLALEQLHIYNNGLTSLDVTQNTSLITLQFHYNQLTTIDLSQNPNLIGLQCSYNELTSLDVSQNSNIIDLFCIGNEITVLDLTQNVSLGNLRCHENQIAQLDLTNNPNLTYLDCNMNSLTALDISQNFNLVTLRCGINNIPSLDLTQKIDLVELSCEDNNISSLDTSDCKSLEFLDCSIVNLLTTLDLSQNTNLQILDCSGNGLMTELNIKNGSIESSLSFSSTQLEFICADDEEVDDVQALAEPTTVVSSYCSFTPGGDFNTITGAIIYDLNEDGCDGIDITQPHIKIDINDGNTQGATFSENSGTYNFYTQAGTFDITPNLENPSWFNVSPITVNIPFADTDNNSTIQDFCITPNGIHNDVEIYLAPIDFARPGFDAVYQIVYRNKGNQTMSGNFELTFNDDVLDFVSATTTPDVQSIGNLSWDYVNLLPFENRSVYVTLNVNSPTETPDVNIGDQLNFNVLINPISGDEVPSDNILEFKQIVVGSYDPNNIICLEGDILPTTQIGDYLSYIINFENIGTFAAQNVVLEIDIDPVKYDINTLRVLNTSDPVSTRVKDNEVKFIFENINLSASGGHGNILLRIKTKNTIQPGEPVTKKANIIFDYNFPIITNDANTVFENLSVDDHEIDNTIAIYPNPVSDVLNISAHTIIKSIQIYDVQGRIIQHTLLNDNNPTIEMFNFTNGVYFIKIKTEAGTRIEKIIKE